MNKYVSTILSILLVFALPVIAKDKKGELKKLLREQLGFNGLIVTDATPMVGFCSAMDRATAVPLSIENGCDMFLFNGEDTITLNNKVRYP